MNVVVCGTRTEPFDEHRLAQGIQKRADERMARKVNERYGDLSPTTAMI